MKMNSSFFFEQLQTCSHRSRAIIIVFNLIIIATMLSGCKHETGMRNQPAASAPNQSFWTPADFLKQIAPADHIVITNRLAGQLPQYQGFSVTISGRKMKNIVHALSLLKTYPNDPGSSSIWDWQLQFYQGTNHLGTANFQGSAIVIDREYNDQTGVLDKLYREIMERTRTPEDKMMEQRK
jgi:hypothetical protein